MRNKLWLLGLLVNSIIIGFVVTNFAWIADEFGWPGMTFVIFICGLCSMAVARGFVGKEVKTVD